MQDNFTKNLNALKGVNSELYQRLVAVKTNSKFEVFAGRDPIDVNILDATTKQTIYKDPVADTQALLEEFTAYSNYPYLFIFGLGNGIFAKALLENKKLKHLIVVDCEIELIYIALNMVDLSQDLKSLRLIIFHSGDVTQAIGLTLLSFSTLQVYAKLYNLFILTPYYAQFTDEAARVNKIFVDSILQSIRNHGNDPKDSIIGMEHFILNMPDMLSCNSFSEFVRHKNSNLAVCVATGPSLTKQLPLLREFQDRVTIISVDASLPVLYKNGIKPDIVTSLERIELTATFFEKTPREFHDGIVFIHSALQHRKVIEASYGTKVIVMRPFGYMSCFGLDDYGYAGIGMSAANLAFEIAYFMEYKTICLIGQDLAYAKDGTTHASDHTFGKKDEAFEKNVGSGAKLQVEAYGGVGTVETNAIWLMFCNFFVKNIDEVKGEALCINATEGGARIKGALEMPFSAVLEKYALNAPKQRIALAAPDLSRLEANKAKARAVIKDILEFGAKISKEARELNERIIKQKEVLVRLNHQNALEQVDFAKVDKTLRQIDALKAYFDNEKFKKYFWEGLRAAIMAQELDLAKIVVKKAANADELRAKNVDFMLSHLHWSFIVYSNIEVQMEVIKRAYEKVRELA